MGAKGMIYLFMFIGGTVGGFLPTLFGADAFSLWPILGSMIGGFLGIWVGFKLGKMIGG